MLAQTTLQPMIYDRTLTSDLAKLLEPGGDLRWLFDFVKKHPQLDFQIGRNKKRQWISVYRGTSRLFTIRKSRGFIVIDADKRYRALYPELYDIKSSTYKFDKEILKLIDLIEKAPSLNRYYQKEGYFQNEFSRKYGICGNADDDFVIIDKEAVVGYIDEDAKKLCFGNLRDKYKQFYKEICLSNPALYGVYREKKSQGNELDFVALDKQGNILLIEFKHGSSTSGIYFSPLQIGLYYDIFTKYPKPLLENAILSMLKQKQSIGLINPDWKVPSEIKDIIPVLIIAEFSKNSSAIKRFDEILSYVQTKDPGFLSNLERYSFMPITGLTIL